MQPDDDPLDEPRFTFRASGSGLVQIAFLGRVVTRLSGRAATRFLERIARASAREQQLAMAKATGHFKHGNERAVTPRS